MSFSKIRKDSESSVEFEFNQESDFEIEEPEMVNEFETDSDTCENMTLREILDICGINCTSEQLKMLEGMLNSFHGLRQSPVNSKPYHTFQNYSSIQKIYPNVKEIYPDLQEIHSDEIYSKVNERSYIDFKNQENVPEKSVTILNEHNYGIFSKYFQCDKCSTKFSSQQELENHKLPKTGSTLHLLQCDFCCEWFTTVEKLIDHTDCKHGKKLCEKCLECFDSISEENLDIHLKGVCQVGTKKKVMCLERKWASSDSNKNKLQRLC